jgi:hypothetical protein
MRKGTLVQALREREEKLFAYWNLPCSLGEKVGTTGLRGEFLQVREDFSVSLGSGMERLPW